MRISARHLAMGVDLGGLVTAPLVGGAAASADGRPGASPSARLVPSAVAIANNGTMAAAGWTDATSVDFLLEVSSDGTISWRGNAPSNRMAVYVAGEGVRSKIITVTARK